MNRAIAVLGLILLFPAFLCSQTNETKPEAIGVDSAQQKLVEVSVTKFEDVAFWGSTMPLDQGLVQIRRFKGSPAGKKPIPGEQDSKVKETDEYVLGAKIEFFKRGDNTAFIYPVKPLPIEGITKTISLWAVGRNYNHILKLVVLDYFGQKRELTVGKLNFMGWKQMTAAVPPNIIQDEYHFTALRGLKVVGILIEFDMMESYGTYYIYLDDIRAVTDLFAEEYRDADDMADGW